MKVTVSAYSEKLRNLTLPSAVPDVEEAFDMLLNVKNSLGGSIYLQDHMLILGSAHGYVVVDTVFEPVEAEA